MMKEITVGIAGINILFLIGVFISLKYWDADWFKKLRKFCKEGGIINFYQDLFLHQ